MVKYVVVAFRVNSENSVYYKKCKTMEELLKAIAKSFNEKNAEFISIRRIARPENETDK